MSKRDIRGKVLAKLAEPKRPRRRYSRTEQRPKIGEGSLKFRLGDLKPQPEDPKPRIEDEFIWMNRGSRF